MDQVDKLVEAWGRERPDLDLSPMEVLSRVTRKAEATYPASCSSHFRCIRGSTASAFRVSIPVTDSTRKAWFSAPRANFSSSRRRKIGVTNSESAT